MSTKAVLTFLKEYAIITLGILCFVLAWAIFLEPNNLVGGGVAGISSILQYWSKGVINMGYTYFVVNFVLILVALKVLGKGFSGKTIYAIIVASVGLTMMQSVIPTEIVDALAIKNGKLMSTIMGGILEGLGIGLTMSQGGSTGGVDIIALIVNKYRNVSPGRMILIMDAVIILSSLLVPSFTPDGLKVAIPEKITTVVYAFILVTISSAVLDLYLSGSKQSVQLFILSKKYQEIADMIVNDLHRGVTVLDGKGWYTKESTEVIMVLTRKNDLNILLSMIKQIDPSAFLSVSYVNGVYGEGFEMIKSNKKQAIKK